MMNKLIIGLSVLTLAISAVGLNAQPAKAWHVSQSAQSACKSNKAVIAWNFTNQESEAKDNWIDLVVSDKQSGKSSAKVSVEPGQTVSGVIDTGMQKINDGELKFKMTWTDSYRQGEDSRTASYSTVDCTPETPVCEYNSALKADDKNCKPPVPPKQPTEPESPTTPEVKPAVDLPKTGGEGIIALTLLSGVTTYGISRKQLQ